MSGCRCVTVDRAADWVPYKHAEVRHRVQPGVKILLDDDLNPLTTMNEFTLSHADKARRMGKSWKKTENSYTEDLHQYKTYLIAIGIEECDVTLPVIEGFASCFAQGVSVRTRQGFAPSTIYRRFGTAIRYHRYRIQKGLPSAVSEGELSSSGGYISGFLAKDPNSPYAALPKDSGATDKIHPIQDTDRKRIFDHLGPSADSKAAYPRRDRLAAETSLVTGMRIDEICSLTVLQILNLARHVDPQRPSKLVPLLITKTKGLRPGMVYLPSHLVEQLLKYIETERRQAIDRATVLRYPCGSRHNCEALFVNGVTANRRDVGNALKPDTLSRVFSSACIAVGVTRTAMLYVLDAEGRPILGPSGEYAYEFGKQAAHTFHDLRHTFAVTLYLDCARVGQDEPWNKVSKRLRHTNVLTTVNEYLSWVDTNEEFLSDAFMKVLEDIDQVAHMEDL